VRMEAGRVVSHAVGEATGTLISPAI
ncbi:phosphoribosylglycinamide formyltransferase, partial [Sinorhizobium meliloti]